MNSPVVEHSPVLVHAALRWQHLNPVGFKALSPQGSLHYTLCRGQKVPSFNSAPLGSHLGCEHWKEVQVLWLFVRVAASTSPLSALIFRADSDQDQSMQCCADGVLLLGASHFWISVANVHQSFRQLVRDSGDGFSLHKSPVFPFF